MERTLDALIQVNRPTFTAVSKLFLQLYRKTTTTLSHCQYSATSQFEGQVQLVRRFHFRNSEFPNWDMFTVVSLIANDWERPMVRNANACTLCHVYGRTGLYVTCIGRARGSSLDTKSML